MDSKHCTWTQNAYQPHTWEVKNKSHSYWSKVVGDTAIPQNWPNTVISTSLPSVTVASTTYQFPAAPTEEDMIKDIINRTDDRGFFNDMVEWLRRDAPKRLRSILAEFVSPMHTGPVAYDRLCEVICHIGFRTSELIERRMILGPSNKWVVEYFKDFPAGSRQN